jgi:hypothetical protein
VSGVGEKKNRPMNDFIPMKIKHPADDLTSKIG